jgi:hypothetical protein
MAFGGTPPGSTGTPNGAALIDDIFGTDARDHHDYDDSMDLDLDDDTESPSGATPGATPSAASASASVCGATPASPAPVSPADGVGAVMLDHASGPFLKGRSGPVIIDRFTSMPRKNS